MRVIPVFPVLALAACGADPAPAPGNGANIAAVAAPAGRGLSEYREDALRGCIGGARDAAPPGTPVEAHCACAIDREMAGKTIEQLEVDELSGAHAPSFSAHLRDCAGLPQRGNAGSRD